MDNTSFNNEKSISEQSQPQADPKGTLPSYERRDVVFVIVMLALGLLFTKLVIWGYMGFDVTIFTLAYLIAVSVWLKPSIKQTENAWIIYAGLCVILSLYFAIYDNIILKNLALMMLIVIGAYFALSASGARIENRMGRYFPIDLVNAVFAPFKKLLLAPQILFADSRDKNFSLKNIGMLVLGFVLVIPVVVYVISLLSQADTLFAGFIDNLFHNSIHFDILASKTTSTVLVALYLFAMVFGSKLLAENPKLTPSDADTFLDKFHFLPRLLTVGAALPLIAVYCLFFFTQRAYFLSGLSGLLPKGWTISEYARQGFFELCAVSGVNLGIISILMALTKKDSGKNLLMRIICVVFTLLSIALVVMSLSKMLLYINFYGLTPKRLYTSAFMVFLLLIFVILTIKAIIPRLNTSRWIIGTMMTLFIAFCILNPDAMIAKHNVERYYAGELSQLDTQLLCYLDDSAVPYMLEAMDADMDGVMEQNLRNRYLYTHMSSKNLTSRKAYKQLESSGIIDLK